MVFQAFLVIVELVAILVSQDILVSLELLVTQVVMDSLVVHLSTISLTLKQPQSIPDRED